MIDKLNLPRPEQTEIEHIENLIYKVNEIIEWINSKKEKDEPNKYKQHSNSHL
jgi:hypothetical protein